MLSLTLSTPGKILTVFNISGSIKPGKMPNFSVLRIVLPSTVFCIPDVKNCCMVISDNSSEFSSRKIFLQFLILKNSLAFIFFSIKPM